VEAGGWTSDGSSVDVGTCVSMPNLLKNTFKPEAVVLISTPHTYHNPLWVNRYTSGSRIGHLIHPTINPSGGSEQRKVDMEEGHKREEPQAYSRAKLVSTSSSRLLAEFPMNTLNRDWPMAPTIPSTAEVHTNTRSGNLTRHSAPMSHASDRQ
jgi:hypothetical protein